MMVEDTIENGEKIELKWKIQQEIN
jgi:hypothetical protein